MTGYLSRWAGILIRRGSRLLPTREVLAVEVGSEQLYAAVVRGRGKDASILDFVSSERKNPGEDLPDSDDLEALAKRLSYTGRSMVLTTPLARTVQLSVAAARLRKLNPYQLAESVRWEVEPFTGINGANALVGAEAQAEADDDVMRVFDTEREADLQVSVLEKNVFLALRQICKRAGLKLQRVYAPDSCFYMAVADDDAARAVLDIGNDLSAFVVLKGRQPQQISAYPLGRESLRELAGGQVVSEAESSLRYIIEQSPPPNPLLVTGRGALDPQIVAWLNELCPNGATAMTLLKERNLNKADHCALNAVFATSVGAALRELHSAARRQIGISDEEPLRVRLKNNAYLMPMVVAVLLTLMLFGHSQWMVMQKKNYDSRITDLAAQVKEREQRKATYDEHKQRVEALRAQGQLLKKQIAFVTGGSDDNLAALHRTLAALMRLPELLTLESIHQQGGHYLLKGLALDAASVSRFAVDMQQYGWCRSVRVVVLERDQERFVFTLELELTNDAQTDQA